MRGSRVVGYLLAALGTGREESEVAWDLLKPFWCSLKAK
jgi:hypothetical protein